MGIGKIITISGVPGVGKSYIKDYLLKNLKNTESATCITTKEKDSEFETMTDVEYVTSEQFQKKFMAGELCGVRLSNEEWYAFKTEQIEKIDDGINLVADVPYDGIDEVKDDIGEVLSIYVLPKDPARAKRELQERYPNPEDLKKKIQEIKEEMKYFDAHGGKLFNIIVRNDYTEQTCENLKKTIEERIHGRAKSDMER